MPSKSKGGRPSHKPKPQDRQKVRMMSGLGIPQHQISLVMSMSTHTLLKHYRRDLDLGKAQANLQVAQNAFSAAKRGEPWAVCFWLKTQAGWREKTDVEVTHKKAPKFGITFADGGPGNPKGATGGGSDDVEVSGDGSEDED